MATSTLALEKGLPANLDAERFVLGAILLDDTYFVQAAGVLTVDDFSLEKHQRIYIRMMELSDRGERIDRVTVANELLKHNQLEACDGLAYLVSLDDGLPQILNLDSYVRIVRDKAILRRMIFAAQQLMNRCLIGTEEPQEILASAEETLIKLGESQVRAAFATPAQIIDEYQGGLNSFLDPSKRVKGVSTGFTRLDEMTGGFHGGELVILAARPSMGKTALALNMATHVATRLNLPVAIFSLEMSKESLLTRVLCSTARVDSHRFRTGYLNQDERRKLQAAAAQLAEAPLFIDDTAGLNLMDMHAKLRRLQAEHPLGMVVVDYLQLMSSSRRVENRVQEVSAMSRGLKLLSKELDVPMLVLSQLSRAPETRQGDHRPQLSDLRESGCLTGDTLVTEACTGKRVPIAQLVNRTGFRIWALNEETLELNAAPVAKAFSTGVKPVFRLTTRLGRAIRATSNHPFRAFGGWKKLSEVRVGERLALPRQIPSPGRRTMSESELALLGHLLGDGCTLPRHSIQYTTKDRDLAEAVASLASEVFGDEVAPRVNPERGWFQVYLASTRHHTHGVGSAVADWLKDLGVWALRSYEKHVPARVFEQPPEAIAHFLRHLWATDGCLHLGDLQAIPRVYYSTSSPRLAVDVQQLLLRLGINARIARVRQKGKGRDQYPVQVTGRSDLTRFIETIGAVGARKQAALDRIAQRVSAVRENTNRDVIPSEAWREVVCPRMRETGMSSRGLAASLGRAYCGTTLYRQNLGRDRARRVAEAAGSETLLRLAISDLYWDEVLSVEPDGVEEVFDLTVPGHHNFVANDIFVHNSIEQDADLVMFIFREEVYKRDREDLRGLAELLMAKQRNGPIGKIDLVFLHHLTKFENRAEDLGELPTEG